MKTELRILRRRSREEEPFWQSFIYEAEDANAAVSTALNALNSREELTDTEGRRADPIRWECSCLQKKCGACAMVINGRPALACDSKLSGLGPVVTLGPLRKFPVIADLITDRSAMREVLREMKIFLRAQTEVSESMTDIAYEASGCLQCGCCLEICPNFCTGGKFGGMAAALPAGRLIEEMDGEGREELLKEYRKRVYEGCGKSLACRDICPAGLDVEKLMVNSNAATVWKALDFLRKKRHEV